MLHHVIGLGRLSELYRVFTADRLFCTGFGRIGRLVLRAALARDDIEVCPNKEGCEDHALSVGFLAMEAC